MTTGDPAARRPSDLTVNRASLICLVSPSHVAANPRLVKEANALHAAGYRVHVVAGWYQPALDDHDREIYERAPWSRTVVHSLTGPRVLVGKMRRNLARRKLASGASPTLELAMEAAHATTHLLARAATRVKADLYIGHTVAGLAAAATAARAVGAPYAFDAEDFHPAETDYAIKDAGIAAFIRTIETHFLPGCAYVTAASPLIGEAYTKTYGIQTPVTVLNVFPLDESPAGPFDPPAPDKPRALYWFSQTIGPGRGLEPLLPVLGKMRTRCDLHLRGLPSAGFPDQLRSLARDARYNGRLELHPPGHARDMARLAAPFDLGLGLELSTPLNRDLCLTNKAFTYLLAGVPVALSPTKAQRQLAGELGPAALLLPEHDHESAAQVLDGYFSGFEQQQRARTEAWQLGRLRYNWDAEKERVLACVEAALQRSSIA